MILEEFGPDIRHIKGEENIVADAINRLPVADKDPHPIYSRKHAKILKPT